MYLGAYKEFIRNYDNLYETLPRENSTFVQCSVYIDKVLSDVIFFSISSLEKNDSNYRR